MPSHNVLVVFAALTALTIGGLSCRPAPKAEFVGSRALALSIVSNGKRVTNRKANKKGSVLVLEYHRFSDKESRWVRTFARFQRDLDRLYRMGYRPVTISEYVENRMVLPPGASPVIMTFDDSHYSQFMLMKDGSINPKTAVGVWAKWAKTHPGFPIKATWYVLPTQQWGQRTLMKKKVAMLRSWGSEIGSHTLTHRALSKLSNDDVKRELAGSIEWLRGIGVEPRSLAYPYGLEPKTFALVRGFEWKGKSFGYQSAVSAAGPPAPPPTSKKLDFYRIPRIQGIDGPLGITYWLNRISAGKSPPYVSP